MPTPQVFLSYSHKNDTEAEELRDTLLASGFDVWWDKMILPGQDWKFEVRKAMKRCGAVLLCLSTEAATGSSAGIYPEALDAIAVFRERKPGEIFLIPVRFSEYEIPPIEIDGTRTLDRLQHVDLFPPEKWEDGVKLLLEALREALKIPRDNVEKLEDIEDYLPAPQAEPHLLITSRTEQPGFPPIPLDTLNHDFSLKLLIQEAEREPEGAEEQEAARYITDRLDGLPLALELAGAYLRHRRSISWRQYNKYLQQNPREALTGKVFASFTRHEADLYSTLKIQEEAFSDEPRLLEILDLLTWSGTAAMGESLLCALLNVDNPTVLTDALSLGVALRLLQQTPDAQRYAIHRLVGEVRREEIPLDERLDWVNEVCERLGDWFQERRKNFADLPHYEAEIDHLRTWQGHAVDFAREHASRLAWLQAYPPYHRGRYHEAQARLREARDTFRTYPLTTRRIKTK